MAVAVAGAVFPDIDFIWYFFVDDMRIHHHRYWVHAPAFALFVGLGLIGLARIALPRVLPYAVAFSVGWWLHILLDAPMGQIMWLWPFDDTLYAPIFVPYRGGHWVMSFVLHWSFLLELCIWATAATLFLKRGDHVH
jgi:hypothetical protein